MAGRDNRSGAGRHRRRSQHPAVRWLGAGALTAGLGAAMANGHAVAYANPLGGEDSGQGADSAAPSGGTAGEKAATGKAPTMKTPSKSRQDADQTRDSVGSGTAPASTVSAQTNTSDGDERGAPRSDPKVDQPGTDLSTPPTEESTEPKFDPGPTTGDPVADEQVQPVQDAATVTPVPPASGDPVADEQAQPVQDAAAITPTAPASGPVPGDEPDAAPGGAASTPDADRPDGESAEPAPLSAPGSLAAASMNSAALRAADPTPVQRAAASTPPRAVPTPTAASTPTAAPTAVTTEAVPAPPPPVAPDPITAVVYGLLTFFGVPPFAHPDPAAPPPPPLVGLWLVVRQGQYSFFNVLPAAQPTVNTSDPATGVVTGSLNASDLDGDALTFTVTDAPDNGAVVLDAAGAFTYTPDADLSAAGGTDSFTVTLDDQPGNPPHLHGPLDLFGLVAAPTVTVTVTVNPVNDAPVAVDDTVATGEETSVVIDVLGNDTDPDGDTLTATLLGDPAHGTVTVNTDGTFTYTPDTDFADTDSFSYTVADGAASSTGLVTVTVNPVNDAPVAVDDTVATGEETSVVIDVLGNDTDPDGDTLTVNLADGAAHGTVTINADGTFTYTPDIDFADTDSFSYTVTDGVLSDTGLVTVTVNPVNDAPVAVDDTVATGEEEAVVIDVLGNDTDADGDTLTVNLADGAAHGTVTINADGTFTYTPDIDFADTDSFSYTVTDGVLSDTGLVTVTVNPVNDTPRAVDDTASADQGEPVVIDVLGNDTDPNADDTLTATLLDGPAHGTVTVNTDGTFTYTPDVDYSGQDSFTYTASDGALSDTATVAITIVEKAVDDIVVTDEDTPVDIRFLANDDNEVWDEIRIESMPAHGSFELVAGAKWVYTPDADYSGADSLIYSISHGGLTDTATVSITINPVDYGPPVVGDPGFSVDSVDQLSGAVSGRVNVADPVDTVTYSLGTAPDPAVGTVTVDSASGAWTFTPDPQARLDAFTTPGDQSAAFVISATDGKSAPVAVPVTGVPIDPAEAAQTAIIPVGAGPAGVAVGGDRLYVTNSYDNTVTVIDTTTNTVIGTITVGSGPRGVAVSGDHLYVANEFDGTVTVIDTTTSAVVDTIDVGNGPNGLTVSGNEVYVTNSQDDTVTVIRTTTNAVFDTIDVGNFPLGVAAIGSRVYVANAADGTVGYILGPRTILTIPVGARPRSIAVSGEYLYVTTTSSATITVIDSRNNTVTDTIPLDRDPGDVSVSGDRLYVANDDGTVTVIDIATNTVVETVQVGAGSRAMEVSGNRIYVANMSDGTVSVITSVHDAGPVSL